MTTLYRFRHLLSVLVVVAVVAALGIGTALAGTGSIDGSPNTGPGGTNTYYTTWSWSTSGCSTVNVWIRTYKADGHLYRNFVLSSATSYTGYSVPMFGTDNYPQLEVKMLGYVDCDGVSIANDTIYRN